MKRRRLRKPIKKALLIILTITLLCGLIALNNMIENKAVNQCINGGQKAQVCEELRR